MATAQTLDLVRTHRAEYAAGTDPAIVEIPLAAYLIIEGTGEPGGSAFQEKLQALFNVAYTIKMARKRAGMDYKVAPLEGLWWHPNGSATFTAASAKDWNWKLLIRVPEFLDEADVIAAIGDLRRRGKPDLVRDVKLERITEGTCVQALHVGPYADEPATLARMEAEARSRGFGLRGSHHEIYLSDPRRVPPERIRTILRQPVAP
jgi:hypothetical protein